MVHEYKTMFVVEFYESATFKSLDLIVLSRILSSENCFNKEMLSILKSAVTGGCIFI